ncbi:hypothetical protein M0R45_007128 [Rubus argutus]|uniref:Uncharacterized protein n=1 Tax=Rubus argutus TaxID=59490 RepID=A0AAW1YSH8_RUBAR
MVRWPPRGGLGGSTVWIRLGLGSSGIDGLVNFVWDFVKLTVEASEMGEGDGRCLWTAAWFWLIEVWIWSCEIAGCDG